MAFNTRKSKDYPTLTNPARKSKGPAGDTPTLTPARHETPSVDAPPAFTATASQFDGEGPPVETPIRPHTKHSSRRASKKDRKEAKDRQLLTSDRWLVRNGHKLTYVGLFLFSIMVLFRPYEIVPALGFLSATAFYFALATILLFIPSQLATEGTLTTFPTEVKAVLAMVLIALLTMPIAKDPALAWETFNDPVIIFIVLVNVVRTRQRLMGMMWLSFGIGVYLGFSALNLYLQGKFTVEEYRVAVDVGGMFGNPNELALHFVMMTPIVFTLGLAAKKGLMRMAFFAMAALFVGANISRGGFLGLIACLAVLAWKLGRKYRLNVAIGSIVIGGTAMAAAPGNYGLRMLSIFVPGLDAVGSSDQRWELLMRSIIVTARNPWGIGIGNFPIVGIRNLQSHNAFTQVSAEIGILGLIAYLVFIISPYRKLSAIERALFDAADHSWFYYLAIGLQASIVGYLVSSFFASVAYNWFVYYLIAYAVAFRRIYTIEAGTIPQDKAATIPATQSAIAV
jgi:O-antigen ligase